MSEIKFKDEQQKVVDLKNKNVIVSASAGSGKTTVMIAKIIKHIIDDNIKIKRILVLTYTKASAEEMKQKLLSAMTEASKTNTNILHEIDDISTADISTFHKFLQKLLKKYFSFVNLNPGFEILEEAGKTVYEKQAFENVLEEYSKKRSQDLGLIFNIYSQKRSSEGVFGIVKKINQFLVSYDNPNDWCKNNAFTLFDEDLAVNKAVAYLQNELENLCNIFKAKFEENQLKCEKIEAKKYIEYSNQFLSMISCLDFSTQEKYFNNLEIIKNFKPKSLTRISKEIIETEYLELQNIKDNFTECLKNFNLNYTYESTEKAVLLNKKIAKILIDLTLDFQCEYENVKITKNLLDFNDLEKFALKLLENTKIREEIKQKYDLIFIDEYQDANRVQEKIVSLISKDNNRFMVGDVKQSIYSFRQAEPELFLEKEEIYKNDANKSESIMLNYNFRSNGKILDFVNLVFNKIMTKITAKVDYLGTSQMKTDIIFEKNKEIPAIEIDLIKKVKEGKQEQPLEIYSVLQENQKQAKIKNFEYEAVIIAQKIKDLVGKQIFMPSENKFREIEFRDISILLATRGPNFDKFCGTLQKFDIPIFSNTNESLFDDCDVEILFNLIKLCKNPKDDVALASVMHSEFGNFSFDELSKIRLKFSNEKFFYEAVEKDIDNSKIKAFYRFIDKTRNGFVFDGLYYTLNKVITEFGFNKKIAKLGVQKVARMKKFLQEVLTSGFNFDYMGFINYVETNKKDIKAPNYVMGDNCVNITTIHSSKGLEYPIVILPNTADSFYRKDMETEIILEKKLGIAFKYYDLENKLKMSNVMYDTLKIENKKQDFADKLRLLYVAMTRAKNHLIIVGSSEEDKIFTKLNGDADVLLQKNFLSLIVGSFDDFVIEKVNNNQDIFMDDLVIKNIKSEEIDLDLDKCVENTGAVVQKYTKELDDYFNFKYPYKTDITLKNSVTSIAKDLEDYTSFNPQPKQFNISEHKVINSPEIGILYHCVFEKIDFEQVNNVQDVKIFIEQNFKNQKLDYQMIFDCIKQLKTISYNQSLKEQKFLLKIKHNKIVQNGSEDEIIVQGVIDLLLIGDKNVLVDYKYTNTENEQMLSERYRVQLKLYKIACEKMLNKQIDEVYLMLIKQRKMLKIVDFD